MADGETSASALAVQDTVDCGMGALSHAEGMAFHLCAQHARQVFVKGDFNDGSDLAAYDAHRSMEAVRHALALNCDGDAFRRVVYSESHDEVANGRARLPHEVKPDDPECGHAQKRSTLAACLMFTAPGVPMLFRGQEFLQGEWFRDDVPPGWDTNGAYRRMTLTRSAGSDPL